MSTESPSKWFDDVKTVIVEPLKFKAKLAIGEDAYTSLRLKNAACEVWDAVGVATTVASIAKSSVVATTFFAPAGILATVGIGTVVTPIGWVIAASVITGGAWVGVTRYIKNNTSNRRVTVIPDFINTPMDVLALGLFDLMAPLALKFAIIDGSIHESERIFIRDYFVKEWGYDLAFVDDGMALIESRLPGFSIKEIAYALAEFKKGNPDCNYKEMTREILKFLRGIMESDGKIDEREEMAIERAENIFAEVGKINIMKNIQSGWGKLANSIGGLVSRKILPSKK